MGKLICSNCGAEVRLPETSSMVTGMTFSKESFGTHYLDMEKENKNMVGTNFNSNNNTNVKENKGMTKQEQIMELLKANGFNMEDFFSARETRDVASEVGNDPIARQIVEDGDVFNSRLDGRWIMAQMFAMLNYKNDYYHERGYNDALNRKGYMYQWDFLYKDNDGELIRLYKRQRDGEDMSIKGIWFNSELIYKMMIDYIEKLKIYIDSLPTYMFKKVLPYKRLGGRYSKLTETKHGDIFVDDLPKLYQKYDTIAYKVRRTENNYFKLSCLVRDFKKIMIIPYGFSNTNKMFPMSQDFKDAYKGNGAYYTALNMINFHKCLMRNCKTKDESLKVLNERAREGCGWKLLGLLKELIEDNDYDFLEDMKANF